MKRVKSGKKEPDWTAAASQRPITSGARPQQPRSPSELLEPARAPGAPRQRGRVKARAPRRGMITFVNSSLTLLLVLMLAGGGLGYAMKTVYEQPGPLDHSTVIVIPPGEGLTGIASRLQREGVITDSKVLLAGFYWDRAKSYVTGVKSPSLKSGEYEIRKSASMKQVVDTLVEGKAILMKVSVPEGLTSYQIVGLLKAQPDLAGDVPEVPAEGTLLPDTYKFSRGTTRKDIIARMQDDAKRFIVKQWETRSSRVPFKTPEEALIMASLVEKETGKADERDRVAGVFLNRINKRMRLQSDPTIIYVVTGGKGALGRGITKSEIEDKNEYNTYQIEGLPPTPICNPGRAAIEAVLNPAQTPDLFFVADGSGGHAFAASIQEHQKNVQHWRQVEREAKAKAAANAAPATQDQTAGPGVVLEMPGVSVDNSKADTPAVLTPAAATAEPIVAADDNAVTVPAVEPAPKPAAAMVDATPKPAKAAKGAAKTAVDPKAAKKPVKVKTP
jgi:UPF0755 protein